MCKCLWDFPVGEYKLKMLYAHFPFHGEKFASIFVSTHLRRVYSKLVQTYLVYKIQLFPQHLSCHYFFHFTFEYKLEFSRHIKKFPSLLLVSILLKTVISEHPLTNVSSFCNKWSILFHGK